MTQVVVGFNESGKTEFRAWMKRVTGRDLSESQIQAYFDSNEYMNFETGENLYIEVPSDGKGNPAITFNIDRSQIEFAEI